MERKRVKVGKKGREVLKRIADEYEAGTLRSHRDGGCSQECEDLCGSHGGCRLSGKTVCLCEDGETFILDP